MRHRVSETLSEGDIEDLDYFVQFLGATSDDFWRKADEFRIQVPVSSAFCCNCGELRRSGIVHLYGRRPLLVEDKYDFEDNDDFEEDGDEDDLVEEFEFSTPLMFGLTCFQCTKPSYLVFIPTDTSHYLMLISQSGHSLRTPNTPDGVAYYLDQAYRSQAVGAHSASAAMYRAALEQLLTIQGFSQRMLGPKIAAIVQAVSNGTAPRWAADLETEFLDVLKDIGNAAIHAGDGGDASKQEELDRHTLRDLRNTLLHLLFLIYEVPQAKAASLSRLKAKAQTLKR